MLLRWTRDVTLALAFLMASAEFVGAQDNMASEQVGSGIINDEQGSAGSSFTNESHSNWCLEEWDSQVQVIDGYVVPNYCHGLGDNKARLFDWCKQHSFSSPLHICVAEAPPFLHKRPLLFPGMALSELVNHSVSSFEPAQFSLREFDGLFAGYDWELVMGIVEQERLMNPETKVKVYPTQLSALYAMKQGKCDIVTGGA